MTRHETYYPKSFKEPYDRTKEILDGNHEILDNADNWWKLNPYTNKQLLSTEDKRVLNIKTHKRMKQ